MFFLQRIVKQNHPLSVFATPTNTYIKNLQEKRKGIKKLSKSLEVMRKITISAS